MSINKKITDLTNYLRKEERVLKAGQVQSSRVFKYGDFTADMAEPSNLANLWYNFSC